MTLSAPLHIDAKAEVDRLGGLLRDQVLRDLRRKGIVVGISGGVDSAVVAGVCARALGPERVLGLLMPERDSSPDSLRLGREAAAAVGVETVVEDVGPALAALGCYDRQVRAIQAVFPDYGDGWRCKLTLPPRLDTDRLNIFQLTVQPPAGEPRTARMPASAYQALVAATNMKQRVRKLLEYTHADRVGFAVAGTPNRLEYELGFFVKSGDGAADVKPIAHLYKTQVYALAEALGVPEEIRRRPPTTDTYSLPQSQEEFYFSLPYQKMDVALFARDAGASADEAAGPLGLTPEQVTRVYKDIDQKRAQARYLHAPPMLIGGEPPT